MPIGGAVIAIRPADMETATTQLLALAGVEIHGADQRGNIVAVLETQTCDEMEQLLTAINECPLVLHAGLTYLNMEDQLADTVNTRTRPTGEDGAGV